MAGQLLDNAAKFTQNGKIEVVANRVRRQVTTIFWWSILSTPVSASRPDQITHLFEKFTVADNSSTSKYGGTGLGLALSQKLCKLMGGEISVESSLGAGSRFTIRMPLVAGRRRTDAHVAATLVPEDSDYSLKPTAEVNHA